MCEKCFLLQTKHNLPNEILPRENIIQTTKTNKLTLDHDKNFIEMLPNLLGIKPKDTILEIGCGDGTLLKRFLDKGYKVV